MRFSIYFSLLLIISFAIGIPMTHASTLSPEACMAIKASDGRTAFCAEHSYSGCDGKAGYDHKGDSCSVPGLDVNCCVPIGVTISAPSATDSASCLAASGTCSSSCPQYTASHGTCSSGVWCCVSTGSGSSLQISTNFDYQLLEKIPGQNTDGSLPNYVKAILNAGLVLIVLSAVFMVMVGGFLYLTSAGNTSRAGTAKDIIFDALIGLGLALLAYLILYVINPDLVNLRLSQLSAESIPAEGSPTRTPVPSTGDTYSNAEAVALLSAQGISVTSSGGCSDQNNEKCTSLDGIPKSTISNVIELKKKTGCAFNITGGTEVGHKTHGTGRPVVDVSKSACLEKVFIDNKTSLSSYKITNICTDASSQTAAYSCSYIEPKPHFHLQFSF